MYIYIYITFYEYELQKKCMGYLPGITNNMLGSFRSLGPSTSHGATLQPLPQQAHHPRSQRPWWRRDESGTLGSRWSDSSRLGSLGPKVWTKMPKVLKANVRLKPTSFGTTAHGCVRNSGKDEMGRLKGTYAGNAAGNYGFTILL